MPIRFIGCNECRDVVFLVKFSVYYEFADNSVGDLLFYHKNQSRKFAVLYEVETKYSVSNINQLLEKLLSFSVVFSEPFEECDTFYQHPCRDFVETDECLRIRKSIGEYRMTYKGPKIDTESKTRREIEILLTSDPKIAFQWSELLVAIGVSPVFELKKLRREAALVFQEQKIEISLDHLADLGDFIELEQCVEKEYCPESLKTVQSLASTLGLKEPIRESYLELMMKKIQSS